MRIKLKRCGGCGNLWDPAPWETECRGCRVTAEVMPYGLEPDGNGDVDECDDKQGDEPTEDQE